MHKVNIYIATSGGIRAKHGKYGYILEYITPKGETKTREGFGWEDETTVHRLTIMAMIDAMQRLNMPCEVTLYIPDPFVRGATSSRRFLGWCGDGSTVKNAELWQLLYDCMGTHQITVSAAGTNHAYEKWLRGKMK